MAKPAVGIIGLGGMGILCGKRLAQHGYQVFGCDLPNKVASLRGILKETGITVSDSGKEVCERSGFLLFCVQTENIRKAVESNAPFISEGKIVGGQTSVKTPEINAFDAFLAPGVNIVTCHSLHGPTVKPEGQTLILIRHRSTEAAYNTALETFHALGSNVVELDNYATHDKITADTQAVTQTGFLSMATGWCRVGSFPWEDRSYAGGIDNVKILMALRMLKAEAHIYAGLAIMNPFAKEHIEQYDKSVYELFSMMVRNEREAFIRRVKNASNGVFGGSSNPILLEDSLMGKFSLGVIPKEERKPNSHLSLLGMVDTWHRMGVNPYNNLICQTPLFRLRLGIAEYLFRDAELLGQSLDAAFSDLKIRGDDLAFTIAVHDLSSIIQRGCMEEYKAHFGKLRDFFRGRLDDAMEKSHMLIAHLSRISK